MAAIDTELEGGAALTLLPVGEIAILIEPPLEVHAEETGGCSISARCSSLSTDTAALPRARDATGRSGESSSESALVDTVPGLRAAMVIGSNPEQAKGPPPGEHSVATSDGQALSPSGHRLRHMLVPRPGQCCSWCVCQSRAIGAATVTTDGQKPAWRSSRLGLE
eukprot:CAMPEP_0172742804 /NCGR_PEP_ID=MMETSP1074-20121228/130515_1 /TAXON_ID=2916 /ORGANISM="Ceratium fusus, Strain PA161109" /LENGTH=164 /DNA_ID=CAMNT_0013573427 /DNA_START=1537 /DNA_END=2032 /DNA_ORIENTATION=-